MNRFCTWIRKDERGANLAEMAIVTVLLLLLLMGAWDFGRMFHSYILMTNAAREGARYASHFPWYADGIRETTIQEAVGVGLALTDGEITILPDPDTPAGPGEEIQVWIEHSFPTFMGGLIGMNEITLQTAASMVVFGSDQEP